MKILSKCSSNQLIDNTIKQWNRLSFLNGAMSKRREYIIYYTIQQTMTQTIKYRWVASETASSGEWINAEIFLWISLKLDDVLFWINSVNNASSFVNT